MWSRVTGRREYSAQRHVVPTCLGSCRQSSVVGTCDDEWGGGSGERVPSQAQEGLAVTLGLGGAAKGFIVQKETGILSLHRRTLERATRPTGPG